LGRQGDPEVKLVVMLVLLVLLVGGRGGGRKGCQVAILHKEGWGSIGEDKKKRLLGVT
jgi:hypothetical protein